MGPGIVANFTRHWLGSYFQGAAPGWGKRRWNNRERARTLRVSRDVAREGEECSVVLGDTPREPFYGMQTGHNRQEVGEDDAPIRPPANERLSLETLLRGYTANGA
jgi:predicted amidohydrolase YtcJ